MLKQLQDEAEQRALLDATPLSPFTEDFEAIEEDLVATPVRSNKGKQLVRIIQKTDATKGVTSYATVRTQIPVFHSRGCETGVFLAQRWCGYIEQSQVFP